MPHVSPSPRSVPSTPVTASRPNTSGERFQLCHPQRRVWFSEVLYPKTAVGNLCGALFFRGRRDELPLLQQALNKAIERHVALRLQLASPDGLRCEQYVVEHRPVELEVLELDSTEPLVEESRRALALIDSPLYQFLLFVLPESRIGFFFKYHHITIDALSVSFLNREVTSVFAALRAGEDVVEPQGEPSYLDYFGREHAYLASDKFQEDEAFWRDAFAGYRGPASEEGAPRSEAQAVSIETRRYEHDFGQALTDRILAFCKEQETTVFRFFMSVFFLYFSRHTHSNDVVLSTGSHNRADRREMGMAGMTVSTFPIRIVLDEEELFSSFLQTVRARISACLKHQAYPFDLLAEQLREQGIRPQKLLSFFINHIPAFEGAYEVERHSPGADLALMNIKINPNQRSKSAPLEICVDGRVELFGEGDMLRFFARIEDLVKAVIEAPDRELREYDHLSRVEREELLELSRPVIRSTPAKGVVELFADAVRRWPDKHAVCDSSHSLTFAELDGRASALASVMRERGVGPGAHVAIVMERRVEFVVAVLATLKVGAAYIPLTPETPIARIRGIEEQANVALVLCDGAIAPQDFGRETCLVSASDDWADADFAPASPGADDVAYIIFTSGSTGDPKGVVVPHRGLTNLCLWAQDYLSIREHDVCAAYCSFTFDVSVIELYASLLSGATLHIVPPDADVRLSTHALNAWFQSHAITFATLPTKVGELFNQTITETSLRVLTVIGEKLRRSHPRSYELINAYGPAEATVYATAYRVDGASSDIPIGRPLWNMWTYVVDDDDRLVARGEEGNLLLAGPQIALGYLGDEELTARCFRPNPFCEGAHDPIVYSTGDLVRWRADGELEFLGRRDRQVKIRGVRVEPSEIEHRLNELRPIVESFVMERAGALYAFYVADASLDPQVVRAHLEERLPSAMIPLRFIEVPTIPLTAHGKTDVDALGRRIDEAAPLRAPALVATTPTEEKLLAIFRAVLGTENVTPKDDFFDLGGSSLLAMELFVEIHERFGRSYPVSLVMSYPTVEGLAAVLSGDEVPELGEDVVIVKRGHEDGPKMFCFHDFSGDVMPYRNLALALRDDLSLYGLCYVYRRAAEASIEALAARYLEQIRALQPRGPYALLGYSIGGMVAFEVAQQLRRQGQTASLLAIIDTPNFAVDATLWRSFTNRAIRHVLTWFRAMSLSYKMMFVYSNLKNIAHYDGGMLGFWRSLAQMKKMLQRYVPQAYEGDMVLLKAKERSIPLDSDLGWKGLVRSLEEFEVEGDHISILNPSNARNLAHIINRLL